MNGIWMSWRESNYQLYLSHMILTRRFYFLTEYIYLQENQDRLQRRLWFENRNRERKTLSLQKNFYNTKKKYYNIYLEKRPFDFQVVSFTFCIVIKQCIYYEEIEGCIEGQPEIGAQKTYHLTYPWILRALFYCARMVSEQKDTEFRHDDYGDLKKVYSIWLFMESPNYAAHTISSYTITHNSYMVNM